MASGYNLTLWMVEMLVLSEMFAGACACSAVFNPVCGVDGITYANVCEADCSGMRLASQGECPCPGRQCLTNLLPEWEPSLQPIIHQLLTIRAEVVIAWFCCWLSSGYELSAASFVMQRKVALKLRHLCVELMGWRTSMHVKHNATRSYSNAKRNAPVRVDRSKWLIRSILIEGLFQYGISSFAWNALGSSFGHHTIYV